VTVEYIEISSALAAEKYPELAKALIESDLPLPAVAINGILRMVGGIDYQSIADAIEAATEQAKTG